MREVERGDIVHLLGDQGAGSVLAVVVQSTAFGALPSLLICPITDEEVDAPLLRIPVGDESALGLAGPAWAMIELVTAVPRETPMRVLGRVGGEFFRQFDKGMLAILGIA
jgi:hypothetical protein